MSPPGQEGARSPTANPWQRTVVTTGYHSRFHFPHKRMQVEFTLEVPLEGEMVLGDWIVTKSEVCDGELVIDGQRIYFDVWVEPKQK